MDPFFSKARYMNRIGFEILARTPVTKITPKLPLPPPPHPYPPEVIAKDQDPVAEN